MKCPVCGHSESRVVDSRPTDNESIRRRRECASCKHRFTTYEVIDAVPLVVVKKDGREEPFDRNKLMNGLMKSCYKRPVTGEQLDKLVNEVEADLLNGLHRKIPSEEIGITVMERLQKLDEVSYVRFASVYREFKDIDTFLEELKQLQKNLSKKTKQKKKSE